MESQPKDLPTTVYMSSADVTTRLNALDLKREYLLDAIRFGATYAVECTRHDPSSLRGTSLWGKTIRKLRDILSLDGWKASDKDNLSLTVHPSKMCAIAVVSGNERTGISDKTPATRYSRGRATREVVSSNRPSFSMLSADWAEQEAASTMQTWFLLHYWDYTASEIRMELSLPAAMTADGFVVQWKERILLGAVGDGPVVARSVPDDSIDPNADAIDIPVLKKA